MRQEADDIGPKAELKHWKQRLAKFNCLVDHVNSSQCRVVVGVLSAAKSKLLKVSVNWVAGAKKLIMQISLCQ